MAIKAQRLKTRHSNPETACICESEDDIAKNPKDPAGAESFSLPTYSQFVWRERSLKETGQKL
jgi:hypothetical protein